MIRCTYVRRALRIIAICAVFWARGRLCTRRYVTMETQRRRPPATASIAAAPCFARPPHATSHNTTSICSVKLSILKFQQFIQYPIQYLNIISTPDSRCLYLFGRAASSVTKQRKVIGASIGYFLSAEII